MDINSIIAKSVNEAKKQAKAQEAIERAKLKKGRKVTRNDSKTASNRQTDNSQPKISIPGLSQAKLDSILKNTVSSHKKKKAKKQQAKQDRKANKPENRPPAFRITVDFIETVYEKLGIAPMRANYWYSYPLLRRDCTNESRTKATPIGAMCLLRHKELPSSSDVKEYQIRHSSFIESASHEWVLGAINQLLNTAYKGLSCSYLLGFKAGYDGNKPWDQLKQLSLTYRSGFFDGHAILEHFISKGLVTNEGSIDETDDIYADETDEKALTELFRVRGYTRKGFTPYKKKEVLSEPDQRKATLKKVFKNGQFRKN